MNFREQILQRILSLLETRLKISDDNVTEDRNEGTCVLEPNQPYRSALRHIELGPIQEQQIEGTMPIPAAYVSFDGGRNDLGLDTVISNVVEVLSIRIDILLDKKIGRSTSTGIREMTFQGSDLVHDITTIVSKTNVQSAVTPVNPTDHTQVEELILEEWEFDDRFRGGEKEILSLVFEIQVTNPRTQ